MPTGFFKQYRVLLLLGLVLFACGCGNASANQQLRILTSFPPGFYTPFIEQFEALHPEITVSVLNKKTTAALEEILRGNDRRFDLFWSSSVDAFDLLKSEQKLRPAEIHNLSPMLSLQNINLKDPEGYFFGFAISGIGWMWNQTYLEKEKLPIPNHWEDLQKPIYYGHLAMSTPSRSGTTHLIVENILQKFGWDEGWSYLARISGNFATITARSFGVPEGIESHRFGVGLVIDFLARTKGQKDLGFRYGQPAFPVPAGIAGLKNSANLSSADQFIRFILSPQGQEILLQPEINRLPVNPELIANREDKVFKLLQLIENKNLQSYDVNLSRQRYHLVNELFDQMITFHLRERRNVWKKLIQLESELGSDNPTFLNLRKTVLERISALPVSRQQSLDPQLDKILNSHDFEQAGYHQRRDILAQWDQFVIQNLEHAKQVLNNAELTLTAN